ncbi:MAG: hypothetical protein J3K34DRAFT_422225 [Monoraphidium minutum]|nr:MAG: hypothetical protein J3K34DRAFT_422225 [Monoraphidium minutum]
MGLAQLLLSGAPSALRRRPSAPGGVTAAWLEAAVQEAVRHIGACVAADGEAAAPFLLLVRPRPGVAFATVPLSEADVASGWAGVAAQVGSAAAQGVLLVRPLPEGEGGGEPKDACVASGLRHDRDEGGDESCSDCGAAGATAAAAAAPSAAAQPGGAPASALIAGRVGECCSGGAHEQPPPPPPTAASCALHASGRPRYYGVVVQGPASSAPDGCYLLKTTHVASALLGCACSHYALTRVSKGPSFHEQLTRSWTV